MSRIERSNLACVSIRDLSLACAAVGLELSTRTYSDADPIRDAGHAGLLERVRRLLPDSAPWRMEVPLPIAGDRRAMDALTILVSDTRHNRAVLIADRESLRAAFPLDGREIKAALMAGSAPPRSGILVL
jgi:hypothetical protein